MFIITLGVDLSKPYAPWRVKFIRFWINCIAFTTYHALGYGYLGPKKFRIQDYDPDYPE